MKKLRIKLPLVYCIVAYLIWIAGQSVFTLAGMVFNYVADKLWGFSSEYMGGLIGEAGCIFSTLLFIELTGRKEILKDRGNGTGAGMLFAIAPVIYAVVTMFVGMDVSEIKLNPFFKIIILILYTLSIGLAEEFLYRGIVAETMLEHCGSDRRGILKAMFISSALFALTHALNIFAGATVTGVLIQVLNAFFMGMLFCIIYFRTGNIMVTAIAHALWDFFGLAVSADGVFDNGKNMTGVISGYKYDNSILILFICITVYVIVIFRFFKAESYTGKWFGKYIKNMQEEKESVK